MNLQQQQKHLEEMLIRKLVSKEAILERIEMIEVEFPDYDLTEYRKKYDIYKIEEPERIQY